MEQKIIRTFNSVSYSNIKTINDYLSDGWFVVSVMPIGEYLEYVIQKNKTL